MPPAAQQFLILLGANALQAYFHLLETQNLLKCNLQNPVTLLSTLQTQRVESDAPVRTRSVTSLSSSKASSIPSSSFAVPSSRACSTAPLS